MSDLVRVGVVRKPHGVQGFVRIGLLTDFPEERFIDGGKLTAVSVSKTDTRTLELVIEQARPYQDGFLVKFEGYETPEDSAELRGMELCISREERKELSHDEFYADQLVGMTVEGPSGVIGKVCKVEEYPAHPVLEIRSQTGRYLMVPFIKEFVDGVDRSCGVVRLSREAIDED
jgi:16S rRNA processing protein RimM